MVGVAARTQTLLAWSLWLATLACCAGGLVAALLWVRPLTAGLLVGGAGAALAFPLGYATVGLMLEILKRCRDKPKPPARDWSRGMGGAVDELLGRRGHTG